MKYVTKKLYNLWKRYLYYRDWRITLIRSRKRRNRAWILKLANYKCLFCGAKNNLTVDHIKAKKDGGAKNNLSNKQCLCFTCNWNKDNRVKI